ncbi:hypothetical protein A7K99_01120 [Tatumella citrea]|uniref:Uncharacterized protein n=1 Tax=Tatumella citrea TaxID=53336 RepID=A0A1Y0LGA4_TATCI|nr:hypothetical protein A7K98_01125 [Tatumella citrea]ARU96558.1 hypothetical protein A7K99_01120 [Tatumella citrea]
MGRSIQIAPPPPLPLFLSDPSSRFSDDFRLVFSEFATAVINSRFADQFYEIIGRFLIYLFPETM